MNYVYFLSVLCDLVVIIFIVWLVWEDCCVVIMVGVVFFILWNEVVEKVIDVFVEKFWVIVGDFLGFLS